ncbi:hypothetical protein BKA62DRAFT_825020, partial [Auriculariales sp. MPI-PUGE-AT-0066]
MARFTVAPAPSPFLDMLWPALAATAAFVAITTTVDSLPSSTRVLLALAAIFCLTCASTRVLDGASRFCPCALSARPPSDPSPWPLESILALPPLGIQLEVRRGLRFHRRILPLHTERLFVPRHALKDLVIHEALHRWNVRYYLSVLAEQYDHHVPGAAPRSVIHLVFKNTLPPFPV